MSRRILLPVVLVALGLLGPAAPARAQTSFTPGNLLVYRADNPASTTAGTAVAVFLDEINPITGAVVQTITFPSTGANAFTAASGSLGDLEGGSRPRFSPDGQFLTLTGYNAPAGTADVRRTAAATIPRTVLVLGQSGGVLSTTRLTDAYNYGGSGFSQPGFTSAITPDGTTILVAGSTPADQTSTGGIRVATAGATTSSVLVPSASTPTTGHRALQIMDGQLYAQEVNTPVTVGTGVPTSGSPTVTPFPGLASGIQLNYILADASPTVPGPDTIYTVNTFNVYKHSLIGGNWQSVGTMSLPTDPGATANSYAGIDLALQVNGTSVDLFITARGQNDSKVFQFTDASGFGNPFLPTATFGEILTYSGHGLATQQGGIRGIAIVPAPVPEPGSVLAVCAAAAGAVGLIRRRLRRAGELPTS